MRSLRTRLLTGLMGLFTLIGITAGTAAYLLDRNEVDESLDAQLRQIALNVGDTDQPLPTREGDGVTIEREDQFVITIWDRSGVAHSSDIRLPAQPPASSGYTDYEVGGMEWRAYTQRVGGRVVQVAQRMIVRQELAAASTFRALLPFFVLLPLSWVLVGYVVTRALGPLGNLTLQLRVWGRQGTRPLSLDGIPAEVLPLAAATNDLITRLQAQIELRERFISDAAHELRTPLTALGLQVRNLVADADLREQRRSLADMTAGVRRMSDLVGQLLQLARTDTAALPIDPQRVELVAAVATSVQDLLVEAAHSRVDVGVVLSAEGAIWAEPNELRTLIGNLLENAVHYAGAGGTVDLSVERSERQMTLEVRDTGPGIPEEFLERVFERFVRVPGTQSEGSGLGLPIVRAIANRCGASVRLRNRQDRKGLVAQVIFDLAEPAPPSAFTVKGLPTPQLVSAGSRAEELRDRPRLAMLSCRASWQRPLQPGPQLSRPP